MALPDGFLDELRSRLSIADVVGRKVMWDERKSNRGKGDMWAPCPFHQEKTASFHVDDRKGYYYCFGCQAKGDAIGFVRETENVGFMEAVEILAQKAGLTMPAPDPGAKRQADRRTQLVEVMERAVRHFRTQLSTAAARDARAYLARRGLDAAACDRWEIGYAPPGWEGLRTALTSAGVALDDLVEVGLAKPSTNGRAPYDVFRDRIMFPIRDVRGRAIAFGARAMDPGDTAKYINSPETPLFDKGQTLFNHGPARTAVGRGASLIVAEGYMDVIALAEAGFGGAVAPLGTAITEAQLRHLWRVSDEPIVALDGDTAGVRAAYRLIDLALPLMTAGQSLRVALLPDKQDPDDLIRSAGPDAMQAVLDTAEPLVALLWRRATDGKVLDSPERRAALRKSLDAITDRITDPVLKAEYRGDLRRRRDALFGWDQPRTTAPNRAAPGFAERRVAWRPKPTAQATTRASHLARASQPDESLALREAVLLACLVKTPDLIDRYAHVLEETPFQTEAHRGIAAGLLACDPQLGAEAVEAAVEAHAGASAVAGLWASPHVRLALSVRGQGDGETMRLCIEEQLAILAQVRGERAELAEAESEISASAGGDSEVEDRLTARLQLAAEHRAQVNRGPQGESSDFEIAQNGARIEAADRAYAREIFDKIQFTKPSRR